MATETNEELETELRKILTKKFQQFKERADELGITFEIPRFGGVRTRQQQENLVRWRDEAVARGEPFYPVGTPGTSLHETGRAFDIRITGHNERNLDAAYHKLGAAGQSLGLLWGGVWEGKQKDPFHFEVPVDIAELKPPVKLSPVRVEADRPNLAVRERAIIDSLKDIPISNHDTAFARIRASGPDNLQALNNLIRGGQLRAKERAEAFGSLVVQPQAVQQPDRIKATPEFASLADMIVNTKLDIEAEKQELEFERAVVTRATQIKVSNPALPDEEALTRAYDLTNIELRRELLGEGRVGLSAITGLEAKGLETKQDASTFIGRAIGVAIGAVPQTTEQAGMMWDHIKSDPIATLGLVLADPFIITANAMREFLANTDVGQDFTQLGAKLLNKEDRAQFSEWMASMTPEEAHEARRAFAVLALSIGTGLAAERAAVAGLTKIANVRNARTAASIERTGVSSAADFGGFGSLVGVGPEGELTFSTLARVAKLEAGVVTGATVFGVGLGDTPEQQLSNALAFNIVAAPLTFAIGGIVSARAARRGLVPRPGDSRLFDIELGGEQPIRVIEKSIADVQASQVELVRMARVLDDIDITSTSDPFEFARPDPDAEVVGRPANVNPAIKMFGERGAGPPEVVIDNAIQTLTTEELGEIAIQELAAPLSSTVKAGKGASVRQLLSDYLARLKIADKIREKFPSLLDAQIKEALRNNDNLGFDTLNDAASAILSNKDWMTRWEVDAELRQVGAAWRKEALKKVVDIVNARRAVDRPANIDLPTTDATPVTKATIVNPIDGVGARPIYESVKLDTIESRADKLKISLDDALGRARLLHDIPDPTTPNSFIARAGDVLDIPTYEAIENLGTTGVIETNNGFVMVRKQRPTLDLVRHEDGNAELVSFVDPDDPELIGIIEESQNSRMTDAYEAFKENVDRFNAAERDLNDQVRKRAVSELVAESKRRQGLDEHYTYPGLVPEVADRLSAETQAGPLPSNRNVRDATVFLANLLTEIKTRFIRVDQLDMNAAIAVTAAKTHIDLRPDMTLVIPGLDSPTANSVFDYVFRTDADAFEVMNSVPDPNGKMNVLITPRGSLTMAQINQFTHSGFFSGQEVTYQGRRHTVKNVSAKSALDKPVITLESPTGTEITVPSNEIRRVPWNTNALTRTSLARNLRDDLVSAGILSPDEAKFVSEAAKNVEELYKNADIETIAATNDMMISRLADGTYRVLDAQTGKLMKVLATHEDAVNFINESGQATGPDLMGPRANNATSDPTLQSIYDNVAPPPEPPRGREGGYGDPYNYPDMGTLWGETNAIARLKDWINSAFPWLTSRPDIFKALDVKFKEFGAGLQSAVDIHFPVNRAGLRVKAEREAILTKIDLDLQPILQSITDPERRRLIQQAIHTYSADDIRGNGPFAGRPLRPAELDLAKNIADSGVDLGTTFNFIRSYRSAIRAAAKKAGVKLADFPASDMLKIRNDMIKKMGLSKADVTIADGIQSIANTVAEGDFSVADVALLSDAMVAERAGGAKGRADFLDAHKFNGKERKAVKLLDDLYREAAVASGFNDPRTMIISAQYARRFGAGKPSNAFMQPAGSQTSANVRNYLDNSVLSGNLNVYQQDPFYGLLDFVNSGLNYKHMTPAITEARKVLNTRIRELGEAGADPGALKASKQVILQYLNDVQGFMPDQTKVSTSMFSKFLGTFKASLGDFTAKQVEALANLFVSTSATNAMAFRVQMGLRDFSDALVKHTSRWGYADTGNVYRKLALDPTIITDLAKRGVLLSQHHLEYINLRATDQLFEANSLLNAAARKSAQLGETGFKLSGQPAVYRFGQAASYLLAREKALPWLKKLTNGEVTKQIAYEKGKIFTFEEGIVKRFDEILTTDGIEPALDFIGRWAALEDMLAYGLSNGPHGSRTIFGKLMLQFGTWPIGTRTWLLSNMSRGTRSDRYAFMARFLASQAAISAGGKAAGLNMSRWLMVPGVAFGGGPAFQLAHDAVGMLTGSQRERERSVRSFGKLVPGINDSRSLILPVGGMYFINDMRRALDELQRGQGIGKATPRGLGIPAADHEQLHWFEYIVGRP